MVPVNREATQAETDKEKKEENNEAEKSETSEPKGDPEMAPIYVRQLLPIFTDVFHSSMLASVRYVSGFFVFLHMTVQIILLVHATSLLNLFCKDLHHHFFYKVVCKNYKAVQKEISPFRRKSVHL